VSVHAIVILILNAIFISKLTVTVILLVLVVVARARRWSFYFLL